jgi:hypothetical protein
MLPVGTMLRATDSSRAQRVRLPLSWLARCEGFRVDGVDGRIGTVGRVGIDVDSGTPAWLEVRIGLFVRRRIAIGVEDVGSVDPVSRRIVTTIGRALGDGGG